MRTVFLSYAYPPLRFPRAIQVSHLVRHSALDPLAVVAAEEPQAPQDEVLLSVAGSAPTIRVGWGSRARAIQRLRRITIRDRFLAPDLFRPWARDAAAAVLESSMVGRGDVLVSFGQPMSDHLAAATIVERTGAYWIAHFSDPWSDNPLMRRGRLAGRITLRQEREVVSRAQAVVFTSTRAADLVMSKYPRAWRRKATVVPHCFDADLYPPLTEGDDGSRSIVIRYVGNFYRGRGPEPLLEALGIVHERNPGALSDVRLELIGSAEENPLAAGVARRLPPGLVSTRGPVSYLGALAEMRSADLLVLVDAPSAESLFLPSKLIEYLGAARPIVALTPPGDAAEVVRDAGGWCADPGDPRAGAGALEVALTESREFRGRAWGSSRIRERFSAPVVAAEFDRLVRCVGKGSRSRAAESADGDIFQ